MSTKASFHHVRTECYFAPTLIYHRVKHTIYDSIVNNHLQILAAEVRVKVKRLIGVRALAAICTSPYVEEHIEVNEAVMNYRICEEPPI